MPKSPPPELKHAVMARNGRREGDEIRFRCPFPESHHHGGAGRSIRRSGERTAMGADESGPQRAPAELRGAPQWVVWRAELRDGKSRKVPYNAATGRRASSTDASSWSTFEKATEANRNGDFTGVGFVFSEADPFCGVDLDDCLDDEGSLSADARAIVTRLNTYTEISPSGRGVKLILRGKLPPGGNRKGKVEIYDRGRYFTITGWHFQGTPTTIEKRQAELDALHQDLFGRSRSKRRAPTPTGSACLEDEELLTKARNAQNGERFRALFDEGDLSAYRGDDSAADLALSNFLSFWSRGDREQIDRLFRRSRLMRPKWDETRGATTYGAMTIEKALSSSSASSPSNEVGDTDVAPQDPALDREEALEQLRALPKDADPDTIMEVVQRFASSLDGAEPLEIETAREDAMRALQKKVSAPSRMLNAALAGVAPALPGRHTGSPRLESRAPYLSTPEGLLHRKSTKEGQVLVPLANFTATIVGEVERDDGVETRRWFEIAAKHRGREHRFEVSAAEFPTMQWVGTQLGATAIVNAGLGTKDHTRAAVQHLSDEVSLRTVFTHLGWRKIGEVWCYFHADGAIGPVGPVPDVETEPPSQLERFSLPEPPTEDDLKQAVRASLGMLDVVPDEIALPIYCAVWRSVLGAVDFGSHIVGQTNEGKTELAALTEQHFGAGLDARHLPGSWSSTGNSLEVLAFAAKDALLVVDDFAPEGTAFDVQRLHREAARLIRAQGNRAGRNRLRSDLSLRTVKYPRGLILSTGEDVPNAHSVRARILILELAQGGVDWRKLTTCQEDAASGLYAQAMAAFLQWVAGHYEELQNRRVSRVRELRAQAQTTSSAHRRTPSIVADLAFGLETFLGFTQELGILSKDEADELWRRGWEALGRAAAAQAEHHAAVEPTGRFLELVASAISSGRAHLASRDGDVPGDPHVWGWRHDGSGGSWSPQGERIGWVDGQDLYLDPDASYRCAQQVATTDGISISARTLWKRMRERRLLASTDTARGRNVVRVTLQGARREVVHLLAATVLPSTTKPAQPAQSAQEPEEAGADGPFLWAGSGEAGEETAHETGPGTAVAPPSPEAPGPIGPIGPLSDTQDPEVGEL